MRDTGPTVGLRAVCHKSSAHSTSVTHSSGLATYDAYLRKIRKSRMVSLPRPPRANHHHHHQTPRSKRHGGPSNGGRRNEQSSVDHVALRPCGVIQRHAVRCLLVITFSNY